MKKLRLIMPCFLGLFMLLTVAAGATEQDEFLKKINGARYVSSVRGEGRDILDVQGDTIITGVLLNDGRYIKTPATYKIYGRTFRSIDNSSINTGVISDDGSTITVTWRSSSGDVVLVFQRVR